MLKFNDIKELIEYCKKNNIEVNLHIGHSEQWFNVSSNKSIFTTYLDLADIDNLLYANDLTYWLNKVVEELRK